MLHGGLTNLEGEVLYLSCDLSCISAVYREGSENFGEKFLSLTALK